MNISPSITIALNKFWLRPYRSINPIYLRYLGTVYFSDIHRYYGESSILPDFAIFRDVVDSTGFCEVFWLRTSAFSEFTKVKKIPLDYALTGRFIDFFDSFQGRTLSVNPLGFENFNLSYNAYRSIRYLQKHFYTNCFSSAAVNSVFCGLGDLYRIDFRFEASGGEIVAVSSYRSISKIYMNNRICRFHRYFFSKKLRSFRKFKSIQSLRKKYRAFIRSFTELSEDPLLIYMRYLAPAAHQFSDLNFIYSYFTFVYLFYYYIKVKDFKFRLLKDKIKSILCQGATSNIFLSFTSTFIKKIYLFRAFVGISDYDVTVFRVEFKREHIRILVSEVLSCLGWSLLDILDLEESRVYYLQLLNIFLLRNTSSMGFMLSYMFKIGVSYSMVTSAVCHMSGFRNYLVRIVHVKGLIIPIPKFLLKSYRYLWLIETWPGGILPDFRKFVRTEKYIFIKCGRRLFFRTKPVFFKKFRNMHQFQMYGLSLLYIRFFLLESYQRCLDFYIRLMKKF